MPFPRRIRPRPGPLFFTTLAWLAFMGGVLRAHDPGLSSLDVKVRDDAISASLSIAASDVALIVPGGGATEIRAALSNLARDAVRFSVDSETFPFAIDEVSLEDGAARVQLSLTIPQLRDRARRLLIASDVPARVSRGHRELMIVSVNGGVVAERLLDATSLPVAVDLEARVPSRVRAAWEFLGLGVHHILSGYDHLVFLAGLLLAARAVRDLFVALTAFTAAHSISLAMVAIGGIHAPASIVEPLIAASIAWVGLENLLHVRHSARGLVVFGFGLIHGFGFAGALMELGVGSSPADVAVALLSFNAGVEAGQLAVAACLLPLVWMIRSRPSWQSGVMRLCSVSIVLMGGYWLIERLP